MDDYPSYHDLYVTTENIPRRRLFDLPFDYWISCTRVSGWELWLTSTGGMSYWKLLAGEYASKDKWLILDVNGHEIVNSRDH